MDERLSENGNKLIQYMGKVIFDYSLTKVCPDPWTDHDIDCFLSSNGLSLYFATIDKGLGVEEIEIGKKLPNIILYHKEMNSFYYYMVLSKGKISSDSIPYIKNKEKDQIKLSKECSSVKEIIAVSSSLISKYHIIDQSNSERYDLVYKLYLAEYEFYDLLGNADQTTLRETLRKIVYYIRSLNDIGSNDGYFSFLWRSVEREIFKREGRILTSKEKINVDREIATASSFEDQMDIVLKYILNYINGVELPSFKSYNKAIQRIKDYVKNNCNVQDISLKSISKKMKLSENYLSRLFKKTEGISFSCYVKKVRLEKAKELLQSGQYNVNEVSRMVGIKYPSYFSRIYKEYYGSSPEEE